jgi:hypothetical protein
MHNMNTKHLLWSWPWSWPWPWRSPSDRWTRTHNLRPCRQEMHKAIRQYWPNSHGHGNGYGHGYGHRHGLFILATYYEGKWTTIPIGISQPSFTEHPSADPTEGLVPETRLWISYSRYLMMENAFFKCTTNTDLAPIYHACIGHGRGHGPES